LPACLLLLFLLSWPANTMPKRCVHHLVLVQRRYPDVATVIVYLRGIDPVVRCPIGTSRSRLLPAPLLRETLRRSARSLQSGVTISVLHLVYHTALSRISGRASCSPGVRDALKWLPDMIYVMPDSTIITIEEVKGSSIGLFNTNYNVIVILCLPSNEEKLRIVFLL
jgi:hypothetical protein